MRLGYNTNGFAHHRLEDAIAILAEIGYRSVAITLDYRALNPFAADLPAQTERVADLLERHELTCVIETGSRFLLDPLRKHAPTLLDEHEHERRRRLDFVAQAMEIGATLQAEAVSFWSGARPDGVDDKTAMERLTKACRSLTVIAEDLDMRLAFEPEPGMFIDTMARFEELHEHVNHPLFGLTLDVGHVVCLDDGDTTEHITAWKRKLFNVHLEDMRRGEHDHLMFGAGDVDVPAVLAALKQVGYPFGVHVELSRHSHDAVNTARRAYEIIREAKQ